MTNKEAEEVLNELNTVRPELLNDKTKRLFDAIMSIADERDLYKQKIDKVIDYMEEKCSEKNLNTNYRKECIVAYSTILDILKGENND